MENSVARGASCVVTTNFTPTGSGARGATLNISDNASNTPQAVVLSGTAIAASVGLTSGSNQTTATISAGQTANYTLSIGGTGMSGNANLTCTGAPQGVTCSVPESVTVNATTASSLKVSVATIARSAAAIDQHTKRLTIVSTMLFLGVIFVPLGYTKRRPAVLYLCLTLGSLILISSCGGSSSAPTGGSGGTPAGTYNMTVTATLNSSIQSVNLTLVIQ